MTPPFPSTLRDKHGCGLPYSGRYASKSEACKHASALGDGHPVHVCTDQIVRPPMGHIIHVHHIGKGIVATYGTKKAEVAS